MVNSLARRLLSRSSLSRCLFANPIVERHNAVKPVNDFKIKTLVGNYRAPSLERLTIHTYTHGEKYDNEPFRNQIRNSKNV
jgi:hypothetical protein